MKKSLSRVLSLILVNLMLISSVPFNVIAEELIPSDPEITAEDPSVTETPADSASKTEEDLPATTITTETSVPVPVPQAESVPVSEQAAASVQSQSSETLTTMETDINFIEYDDDTDLDGNVYVTGYTGSDTSLVIPAVTPNGNQVTGIATNAFKDKATLTSIELPYSLQVIEAGAFYGCTGLTDLVLPPSLTNIQSEDGNGTFANTSGLTVTIPATVTSIGPYLFQNATNPTIKGESGSFAQSYAVEYNITFVPITDSFYVKSFTTSLSSGQNINTAITLTAAASGGTGTLNYGFYYDLEKLDGTYLTNETLTDFATARSVLFTPTEAGIYTLYTRIKDEDGNIVQRSIGDFEVINLPIVSLDTDKASPQYYYDYPTTTAPNTIALTASVDSGSGTKPFDYSFKYQKDDIITEITAINGSSNDSESANFTTGVAEDAGTYIFMVTVTDSQGQSITKTIEDYQVVDGLAVQSLTVDQSSPQEPGSALKLTASAAGGKTAISYRFYYTLDNGPETEIQDYSTSNTSSFSPSAEGSYKFYVSVKNASGIEIPIDTPVDFTIAEAPAADSFTVEDGGIPYYLGDPGTIALTVNGISVAEPASCQFYYSLDSDTEKHLINTLNNQYTLLFDPTSTGAGIYTFYVTITSDIGGILELETEPYIVYEALDTSLDTDIESPQDRNTELKLSALASGGKSPYTYQFYSKLDGVTTEQGDDSTRKYAKFSLAEAGNYLLGVTITDANGKSFDKEIPYTINNNPLISKFEIAEDPNNGYYIETDLTFNSEVDGGLADYSYVYTIKRGSTVVDTQTFDAISTTTHLMTYNPSTSGTYSFILQVTDANGETVSETIKSIKVLDPVTVKYLKVNKYSGQNIGTELKLTASPSGGKSPFTYNFSYSLDGVTKTLIDSEKDTNKYVSFTPETEGLYTFYVTITDYYGKETSDQIDDFLVINDPLLTELSGVKTGTNTAFSDFYAGDTYKLTATSEYGSGDLTYTFYYMDGKTKMPIGEPIVTADQTASIDFTPTEGGTYSIYAEVKDSNTLTPSISKKLSLKVLSPVSAKTIKLSKTKDVTKFDIITLSTSGTGGKSSYSYEFFYSTDNGLTLNSLADADTSNKIAVALSTLGLDFSSDVSLTFYVKVTDRNEVVSTNESIQSTKSSLITITNPPVLELGVSPEKGTADLYPGDTATLTGLVKDGSGDGSTEIHFYYQLGSGTKKEIEDSNSDGIVDVTLTDSGSCKFYLEAEGAETQIVKSYTVLKSVSAKAIKISKTKNVLPTNTVILTASASGGRSPYTYNFYYSLNGSDTLIKETTDRSIEFNFNSTGSGEYTFYYTVTDANYTDTDTNGKIIDDKTVTQATVSVSNPAVIDSFTVSPEKGTAVYVGETVTLSAGLEEGSGTDEVPTCEFFYQNGREDKVSLGTINFSGDTASVSFEPTEAGTYKFYVEVTDPISQNTTVNTINSYKILSDLSIESLKISKTSDLTTSDTIRLSATITGGKSPYTYKYEYKVGSGNWIAIDSTSRSASLDLSESGPGQYAFRLSVTDGGGKVSPVKEYDSLLTVSNPPIIDEITVTPTDTSSIFYAGKALTVKADLVENTGDSGTLHYVFNMYNGSKLIESVDSGSSNQAEFTPDEEGSYKFIVEVTDANTSEPVTQKSSTVKVVSGVMVKSLKVDKASGQNLGTTLRLTASAIGGKSPYQYEFYAYHDSSADEILIQAYSSSKTASYTPEEPGTYTFHVRIKDSGVDTENSTSTNSDEIFVDDFEILNLPVIDEFTANIQGEDSAYASDSDGLNGSSVILSAEASGGSGPYTYTYSYKLGTKSEVKLETYTDSATGSNLAVFMPDEAGTYTLNVTVTDHDGNTVTKTINYFRVYDLPEIDEITVSKTEVDAGYYSKLSVYIDGGQYPYQYKFEVKDSEGSNYPTTPLRDFSTTRSYYFKTDTPGTYYFRVTIKDKNGKESIMELDTPITVVSVQ
ncbi:triple tyrosine motif-containing protein [Eubacteriaceae bacterium ES3]|nr:triple tyrosine motif-containing protein [Eubacteriaceae bacterium ES3]